MRETNRYVFVSVYTKAICQLLDVICAPLLQTLERRLAQRTSKLNQLKTEKARLELQLAALDLDRIVP